MTGYGSAEYAKALGEFGQPLRLRACEGWLLERAVPGRPDRDAMGCYPLFSCQAWDRLGDDLNELRSELVSLVLVADPFGTHGPSTLSRTFNAGVVEFKSHYAVELGAPIDQLTCPHHRRNASKALRRIDVERVEDPRRELDGWVELYAVLVRRHGIRGISAFSRASFETQMEVPGLVMFSARVQHRLLGMLLWYVQNDVAYYHLGAYSQEGYDSGASFALFWRALEYFTPRVRWANLGAGAGVAGGSGGLDRFKSGWATTTRPAYLCRHIFQPERFNELVGQKGATGSRWFPPYRASEVAAA